LPPRANIEYGKVSCIEQELEDQQFPERTQCRAKVNVKNVASRLNLLLRRPGKFVDVIEFQTAELHSAQI
jgi:hypothetical protein